MGIPCRKGSELGIGRLAMGHPANTQVELTHGSVCLRIQESVYDCAWKLLEGKEWISR